MAMKLVAPWVEYYKKLDTFFKYDDDVNVVYDYDEQVIHIYVEANEKANALAMLLPTEKVFGNVVVKISVAPANEDKYDLSEDVFAAALGGNEALAYIQTVTGVFDITYVVFVPEVVQYYTDNLGDINGFRTTLYQELAKELFGDSELARGVYFCTDIIDSEDDDAADIIAAAIASGVCSDCENKDER